MWHQNSLSCQRAFTVWDSACPLVRWPCFFEANAPGDDVQVAAQPKRGNLTFQRRTRRTKWWRVYLKQMIVRVVTYFAFPEFILLEISSDTWRINKSLIYRTTGHPLTAVCVLRMCFLDCPLYRVLPEYWSNGNQMNVFVHYLSSARVCSNLHCAS